MVDASLAAQWVINEPYSAEALRLLAEWEQAQVVRMVPCWFAAESAAVLFRRIRAGHLTLAEALAALEGLLQAVTMVPESTQIAHRAIEMAMSLNQSRPYDALYAALAERYGCELWTADQRFYNAARRLYPWVRWIGEYQP